MTAEHVIEYYIAVVLFSVKSIDATAVGFSIHYWIMGPILEGIVSLIN